MSKYYYHGVKRGLVLDKALEIFQKGGIKCMPGVRKIGFNGLDHVSVCMKEPVEEYGNHSNNAFYNYVQNSICFIILDTIETIKPEIIENADKWNRFELVGYMNSKPGFRFSDMFDEWQVKDQIVTSSIIGIGLPMRWLDGVDWRLCLNSLQELKEILSIVEALGLDIVDSSRENFVEEYELEKRKNPHKIYQIQLDCILGSDTSE